MTVLPSASETDFVSGSMSAAACWIQVTPFGITSAYRLRLFSTVEQPPPASVHSGWW